jgi:tetratricopeptide (TPR) repeat protein
MSAGLLWTIVGSVAAILAVGVAIWQLRLQIQDRRDRERIQTATESSLSPAYMVGGLPVSVPLGRLPTEVRGRDALLDELHRPLAHRLGRPRVWVLAGMGGLGKSTVALSVAKTARARGWQVWWVTATDSTSLLGGMLEILGLLGAPESVTRPVREASPTAPERAWEFLNGSHSAGRRWLLVFDNADNPAVLAAPGQASPADGTGWLRSDPAGMVLVTTRNKDLRTWGSHVVFRELSALDETTAAQVLTDLAPGINDPAGHEARELGHRLGGLPLALHLAGSYLASPFARWRSFISYAQALDGAGFPSALADLDDPGSQTRAAIQQTWELSLDGVATDGRPQARPLLFTLSCYAPDTPIPAALLRPDLLLDVLSPSPRHSDGGVENEPHRLLRDGLHALSTVGLIDTATSDQTGDRVIAVHRVVADVNRARLLTTARSELYVAGKAAVNLLLAACKELDDRRPTDWPSWRRLVPHATALLGWLAAQLDAAELTDLVSVSAGTVDALCRSGNPAAAAKLARSSATAAGRLGDDHPASLLARHTVATVVAQQGRNNEAERLFRQVLADRQRVLGGDHPQTLDTCQGLARVIGLRDKPAEAEQLLSSTLAHRRQLLGEDHRDTLVARHSLAWAVGMQGRNGEAEQLFRQVLTDRQRILGDDHRDTLATCHRLGWVIARQGRYGEAEQLFRQVLTDRRQVLGDDHPDTLASLQRLAWVLAGEHRDGEAEQLYRQVLVGQQRVLGNEHPAILSTRHKLASVIAEQGRWSEAEQLLRQVLADQQRVLGDGHHATIATHDAYAKVSAQLNFS